MSYRYSRSSRSGSFRRTSRRYGSVRKYSRRRYTGRPSKRSVRFATVGYSKSVEKKYVDRALKMEFDENVYGPTGNLDQSSGYMIKSNSSYRAMDFNAKNPGAPVWTPGDLLKGINQGTSVYTRIGNKVTVRYVKGKITLEAATVNITDSSEKDDANQYGEAQLGVPGTQSQYLRTTWRVAIVRDNQVNSNGTDINWEAVFKSAAARTWNQEVGETTVSASTGSGGGIHADLNVDNMGRFTVYSDRTYNLDADDPQKTINFNISGSRIGTVRYNSGDVNALTDKGIYIIAAAMVGGVVVQQPNSLMKVSSPLINSRLSFVDQ